jgi:hypothetical protein
MQSLPDARQQTFEEIYGPPENFLEIEVRLLLTEDLLAAVIYLDPYPVQNCTILDPRLSLCCLITVVTPR